MRKLGEVVINIMYMSFGGIRMKINENMIYREKDEVIFNTRNGKMIEFNESGNYIISCIYNGISKNEIIDNLAEKYSESDKKDIYDMVNEFIEEGKKAGVIVE